MVDDTRARKLADRIRVLVAELLQTRIKDPRLGFVTITDAHVTNDLQQATVYYTVYGDDEERAATAAALASATGILRSQVGRVLGVRHTPTLTFVADVVPERAGHIEQLVRHARAADDQLARAASRAGFAGEADPYRHPIPLDGEGDDEADEDASS